jgi:hypothetical protein
LGIFNILDDISALDTIVFIAVAVNRLPGVYIQEAINLCSLTGRQNHTDVVIANLTATIVNTTADSDGASTVNDVTEVVGKMDYKLQKVSLDFRTRLFC